MRKNVGTLDASMRITLGLIGLAYSIGRMSRRPYRAPWFLMTMSAMKVAEGLTRFCPMLYAMGTNTRNDQEGLKTMMGQMKNAGKQMSNVIPSSVVAAALGNLGQTSSEGKAQTAGHTNTGTTKGQGLTDADKQIEREIKERLMQSGSIHEHADHRRMDKYRADEYRNPDYQ